LEAIATSFRGVTQAYAISAGREVRVIVKPEAITDVEASLLVNQLTKKIEEGMEYPGTIKVTVIREVRYSEMAK
jgi:ribonucrease Y